MVILGGDGVCGRSSVRPDFSFAPWQRARSHRAELCCGRCRSRGSVDHEIRRIGEAPVSWFLPKPQQDQ
jgi:hypothetical protein